MTTGALLVGWDGATWDLLDPLLDAGRLPNFRGLIERGVRAPLRSTIPPVTPAAWTEMATGLNAGRSGVLGFRDLDLTRTSGFSGHAPSSAELRGKTLFEWAGRQGVPVSLVGWPMTFPAYPLPAGALLAGWPRPRGDRPPVAPAELDADGRLGEWESGDRRPRHRDATVEQDIAAESWWDRRHAEVACLWLRQRNDPLTAVVLSGTDHLAHRLWGDPRLADHFDRADDLLGDLLAAAGDRTVLVVSDHGFGPGAERTVHVLRALEKLGWCHSKPGTEAGPLGRVMRGARRAAPKGAWKAVRDRLPHALRRWGFERAAGGDRFDRTRTRAFAVELHEAFVGVHLCVRGRMPDGIVDPVDVPRLRDELADALRELRDPAGEPLVEAVVPRESLYSGPLVERIPDLLVQLREDCRWGDGAGSGPVVEAVDADHRARFPGAHRRDGIVVLSGPGVRAGATLKAPTVRDVGLSFLAAAGVPIPDDRDGRVWEEALTQPVRFRPAGEEGACGAPPTAAEQAAMDDALRALGYL
jgi:predicted AlkP superfamily phosphohydrolase/phosphomutase